MSQFVSEPPTSGKLLLRTSKGDIEIELWPKEAPKACRNIVTLALEGYYDNILWHRVVPGFCIQTGDPTGTGTGGESIYGQPFADEFHQRLRFHKRGIVAMANAGEPNTNDSQFFITLDAAPELQNKHTVFGRIAGATIYNVLALAEVELSEAEPDRPIYPPKLHSIEVIENPFPDIVPRITKQQREEQERARREFVHNAPRIPGAHKKKKKNTALLSFGDEEDVPAGPRRKGISSHDLLNDAKLSKEPMRVAEPAKPLPQEDLQAVQAAPITLDAVEEHVPENATLVHHIETTPSAQEAPEPKRKGHSLLASITDEYRKKSKKKEHDTLSRLEDFMRNIRDVPERKRSRVEKSDASALWGDENEREYGASDDDDEDWRSHRFDSGGVPLTGRKEDFSVEDYVVVDSRDTRSSAAVSLGFGGSDKVSAHAARHREQRLRSEGRRGRDYI
ncbi:peptidylprolyl isomerase [Malassezia cuniculi]|uniref:Peptidyl-prolyl isomerase CWC27 n=1 Tax=Malassezia cuniculi TaxID=948313 RepID=A0AAF0J6S7_9BASI|nr:peptidylprolyl isomerase [Malassezia cuniculi]